MPSSEVARHLGLDVDTVRLWRGQWLGLQGVLLADLPDPRLACEAPSQSSRPFSQWHSREIADKIVRRGILSAISLWHAARLVNTGDLQPHRIRS